MSRWAWGLAVLGLAAWLPAQRPEPARQQEPAAAQEAEPPEEDESAAPREYAFNPLQAVKEIRVGNYYFKKGSYRAAALRYEEATKWDPGNAEAYLRLGDALTRQKDKKGAAEAYAKYLEIAPDAKNAAEIRKRIGAAKP
jgi:tetratricopeptide (TPR) repeat protein